MCPRDKTPTRADIGDPLIGAVLGERYRILDHLASGGMGQVYQAAHTRIASLFAVKVLYGNLAYDASMRERFAREAEVASFLQSRHIVRVVDFSQSPTGLLYIAMEFLDGVTVADRVVRSGRLPPSSALAIARQIARGLAHAHERGVVHRDLKSENVILVREDEDEDVAKILDFGVARLKAAHRITAADTIMGTPAFMAPEQFIPGDVDARADVYALGVVLFEMLTGSLPFEAESYIQMMHMHRTAPRPPLGPCLGQGPAVLALERLLDGMLAKRPDDRFSSARELGKAMGALLEGGLSVARPAQRRGPVDEALLGKLGRAITVGAPTYNAGDHAGCYAIYRATAEEALREEALGLAERARLLVALEQAHSASTPTFSAWIMRYAFDDLLTAQPLPRSAPRDPVDEAIDAFSAILERVHAFGRNEVIVPFSLGFARLLRAAVSAGPARAGELAHLDHALTSAASGPAEATSGILTHALERLRGSARLEGPPSLSTGPTVVGPAVSRIDDRVREALLRAIRIGVPAYNAGDHAACAREYLRTADALVAEAAATRDTLLASWLGPVADRARALSPHDGAWMLRHAFDALLALEG